MIVNVILYIGMHGLFVQNFPSKTKDGAVMQRLDGVPASVVKGPGKFYFDIIDMLLQIWTVKKRCERLAIDLLEKKRYRWTTLGHQPRRLR